MACLNSKVYTGLGGINKKGELYATTSCKGAQQKRSRLLKEHFLNVLSTTDPHLVENAGFCEGDQDRHELLLCQKKGSGRWCHHKPIHRPRSACFTFMPKERFWPMVSPQTYTQTKIGMSYFYAKRKVLADGVTTNLYTDQDRHELLLCQKKGSGRWCHHKPIHRPRSA